MFVLGVEGSKKMWPTPPEDNFWNSPKPIECAGRLFSDKEFLPFLVLLQHSSVAFYMNVIVLYVGNFSVEPCALFSVHNRIFFFQVRLKLLFHRSLTPVGPLHRT